MQTRLLALGLLAVTLPFLSQCGSVQENAPDREAPPSFSTGTAGGAFADILQ